MNIKEQTISELIRNRRILKDAWIANPLDEYWDEQEQYDAELRLRGVIR